MESPTAIVEPDDPRGRDDAVQRVAEGEAKAPDGPDRGFRRVRVREVVQETPDAVTLVLDQAADPGGEFCYKAGQFVTLRVNVDGAEHLRCYSMSSSPATRENLRLTVKRDRGGMVSNWINDTTAVGDVFEVSAPAGAFVLDSSDKDLVAFAGGSGITPVYSLIRTALITTARHVRLFYANRERASVIFARGLDDLVARNPDRITVYHHLDEVRGVVRAQDIAAFTEPTHDAHYYICGPSPFMQTVEDTLVRKCIGRDRLHLERFQISEIAVADVDESGCGTEQVTITLDQRRTVATYRAGNTLLQTARLAGLRAPASCETGSCGTCMARLTKGSALMHNNDALTEDEVAEGWVLTCQSLPTSPTVEVVYE